jgi:hypothetical protein
VSYTPRGCNQLEIAGEKTAALLVQKKSKPTRVQERKYTNFKHRYYRTKKRMLTISVFNFLKLKTLAFKFLNIRHKVS